MERVLLIRSSSHPDEPYKMRFSPVADGIRLRCYCPAGAEQMLCKHVIGLLSGKRDLIFDHRQAELFDEARALADQMGAVDFCLRMESEISELKRRLETARRELKERLCLHLREGKPFG